MSNARQSDVKATVIVPLWNHAAFVERQLQSILAQWRPDLEVLVIDDGSVDDGFRVAHAWLTAHPEIRSTLVRNANTLGASLPTVALQHASGPIIIEADSDDVALPGRFDRILRCFDEDPTCHLVTSNALLISSDDMVLGLRDVEHGDAVFTDPGVPARRFGDSRWLGATSAFRREVFEAFPPIDDETCAPFLDCITPFRATLLGSHHYVAEPLIGWRQHSANAHRLYGALESQGPGQERFRFLELTVLAQKLRDAELARTWKNDGTIDEPLMAGTELFFSHFVEWTRLRMKADQSPKVEFAGVRPYTAPIPPISTVSTAPESFAAGTRLGAAAALASGFHQPEEWGIWTSRHAVLSLRIGAPGATGLRLLVKRITQGQQRLHYCILGWKWGYAELEADINEIDLPLPPGVAAGEVVTLLLSTPDALIPVEISENSDGRLLGVGLVRLATSSGQSSGPM